MKVYVQEATLEIILTNHYILQERKLRFSG